MSAVEAGRTTLEWDGGSLDELLVLLGEQALSAHIEAVRPGNGQSVGLVEVVAGGVSDTIAGDRLGEDAQSFLQKLPGLKFRVSPALPNSDGSLSPPGTDEGSLKDRPLTSIMRYCEDFTLTCALEITRNEQSVRISYRRGEIVRILVDGSEAPERLPDVIGWHDGLWRIVLPQLNLPRPRKPQRVEEKPGGGTLFGIPAPIIPGITAPAAAAAPAPTTAARAPGMTAPPVAAAAAPAPAQAHARTVSAPPVASVSPPAAAPVVAPAPSPSPPVASSSPPAASRTEEVTTAPNPRAAPVASPAATAATIVDSPRSAPAPAAAAPATAARRPEASRATAPPATASASMSASAPASSAMSAAAASSAMSAAQPRTQTPRPTFTGLPLVVHVVLGVALGAAVVAGYWAYLRYGVQLGIR